MEEDYQETYFKIWIDYHNACIENYCEGQSRTNERRRKGKREMWFVEGLIIACTVGLLFTPLSPLWPVGVVAAIAIFLAEKNAIEPIYTQSSSWWQSQINYHIEKRDELVTQLKEYRGW